MPAFTTSISCLIASWPRYAKGPIITARCVAGWIVTPGIGVFPTAFRQERWGHDRVQAEFNRRLIRDQKVFPTSLRFIHNDLLGRRHTADYSAQHVGARTAERCLRKATEMVSTIAAVLEQT